MSKKMIVFIAALATLGAAAYAAYNAFNQLKDVDYEFDLEEDIDDDLVQQLKEKYLIKEEEPSLDDILEKIHKKGVSSLTIQEKSILNNYK